MRATFVDGISTEPDLVFVSWTSLEEKRVTFVSKAGRPDEDEMSVVR